MVCFDYRENKNWLALELFKIPLQCLPVGNISRIGRELSFRMADLGSLNVPPSLRWLTQSVPMMLRRNLTRAMVFVYLQYIISLLCPVGFNNPLRYRIITKPSLRKPCLLLRDTPPLSLNTSRRIPWSPLSNTAYRPQHSAHLGQTTLLAHSLHGHLVLTYSY